MIVIFLDFSRFFNGYIFVSLFLTEGFNISGNSVAGIFESFRWKPGDDKWSVIFLDFSRFFNWYIFVSLFLTEDFNISGNSVAGNLKIIR